MVLPKAQIEDSASATIVRAQMHLQELQVVDVDRICKQVGTVTVAEVQIRSGIASFVFRRFCCRFAHFFCPFAHTCLANSQ